MPGNTEPKGGAARRTASHIALLRGINMGGKNKLPMKGLIALFTDAGCEGVHTYIQSGNVAFRAAPSLVRRLPKTIAAAITARFGYEVPVMTRSAAELRKIAKGNPFLKSGQDIQTLHVAFLADRPSPARVSALDANRSPPDAFAVRGSEIYLHCPNGMARTRLTNAHFDARLATTSTVRNWRTLLKLLELLELTGGP